MDTGCTDFGYIADCFVVDLTVVHLTAVDLTAVDLTAADLTAVDHFDQTVSGLHIDEKSALNHHSSC